MLLVLKGISRNHKTKVKWVRVWLINRSFFEILNFEMYVVVLFGVIFVKFVNVNFCVMK